MGLSSSALWNEDETNGTRELSSAKFVLLAEPREEKSPEVQLKVQEPSVFLQDRIDCGTKTPVLRGSLPFVPSL